MYGTADLNKSQADEGKCQGAISKSVQKHALAALKEKGKCFERVLKKGGAAADCDTILPKVTASTIKAESAVTKGCSDELIAALTIGTPVLATAQAAAAELPGDAGCIAEQLVA